MLQSSGDHLAHRVRVFAYALIRLLALPAHVLSIPVCLVLEELTSDAVLRTGVVAAEDARPIPRLFKLIPRPPRQHLPRHTCRPVSVVGVVRSREPCGFLVAVGVARLTQLVETAVVEVKDHIEGRARGWSHETIAACVRPKEPAATN